jgi:hypothetical protein
MNKKQRSCDGRGGSRSAPFWRVKVPKKTDMCSSWARTDGQNPLVYKELYESFLERPAFFIGSEVLQVAGNRNSFFSLQCVSTVRESREIKVLMIYSMDGTEQEFVKSLFM